MKLVNVTHRNVYSSSTGTIAPGKKSPDIYHDLEKALSKVVDICGKNFGIILNERESKLIETIMNLDELGEKFDPMTIPAEIRNDPLGKKRASEMSRANQQALLDAERNANSDKAMREAIINGEVDERQNLGRRPVGPATMEGKKVEPSMLKSGFEAILEENARIAAGKQNKPADPREMLDPIGTHMKKEGAADPLPANNDGTGIGDAKPIKEAHNRDDDGTRSADTSTPTPVVGERASAMDRQAAETARKLSIIGPDIQNDAAVADVKSEVKEVKSDADTVAEDAAPKKGRRGRRASGSGNAKKGA